MAVVMIPFRPQIKFLVIGNHHAAFAGGNCFNVIKAERSHIAEAAQLFAFIARAATLRVVFQNQQLVFAGDVYDLVNVCRRTAHVHGDDRLGVRGFLLFDFQGIKIKGIVDIHHDGNGAHFHDRFICR